MIALAGEQSPGRRPDASPRPRGARDRGAVSVPADATRCPRPLLRGQRPRAVGDRTRTRRLGDSTLRGGLQTLGRCEDRMVVDRTIRRLRRRAPRDAARRRHGPLPLRDERSRRISRAPAPPARPRERQRPPGSRHPAVPCTRSVRHCAGLRPEGELGWPGLASRTSARAGAPVDAGSASRRWRWASSRSQCSGRSTWAAPPVWRSWCRSGWGRSASVKLGTAPECVSRRAVCATWATARKSSTIRSSQPSSAGRRARPTSRRCCSRWR